MLIRLTEFSNLIGVSTEYMQRLKKSGAVNFDGAFIDVFGEKTGHYLRAKGLTPEELRDRYDRESTLDLDTLNSRVNKSVSEHLPDIIDSSMDMSQQVNLVKQRMLLEVRKLEADCNLKEAKLSVIQGNSISREIIERYVFNYFDLLNKNILNVPMQAVDRVIAIVDSSDDSRKKIVEMLTHLLGTAIKSTKTDINKRLKDLKNELV